MFLCFVLVWGKGSWFRFGELLWDLTAGAGVPGGVPQDAGSRFER